MRGLESEVGWIPYEMPPARVEVVRVFLDCSSLMGTNNDRE